MNPVSEDIKDLLVSAGLGVFASTNKTTWGIFIGEEPEKVRRAITIYDTGGLMPVHTLNTRRPLEKPTYQVRVKGGTYLEAYNKLEDIVNELERRGAWTANNDSAENTVRYSDTFRTSDYAYLGKDTNGNFIWVVDFIAYRQERTY